MKGQTTLALIAILVVAIMVVGVLETTGIWKISSLMSAVPGAGTGAVTCPDDGATSVSINVYNDLNTSGTENFDVTMVLTSASGHTVTITDTSAPTASELNCGEKYTGKAISASGANGDHSVFTSVRRGAATIVDGNVEFVASGNAMAIDLGSTQHARLQARVYDKDNAAFMYDASSSDGSAAGTYRTHGTVFQSTTNATANAIGAGGSVAVRMDIKAQTNSDIQLEDRGFYMFIEASSSVYDIPGVYINSVQRTSNCAQLNADEAKKYNDQDYCYFINDVHVINTPVTEIDLTMKALSGVNPTSTNGNYNVTFVSVGAYQATMDSKMVKVGAVKDDTSQTVVLNEEEFEFDVS